MLNVNQAVSDEAVRLQPRTGARILVDQLILQGVELASCVPGESYLGVLDALRDAGGIRVITCRQEGGAAMIAEAAGKLTGRPGVCMASRGPGATNASAGLHVAMQDSTPMVLFIGQVARDAMGREGFQELDYRQLFSQMAKDVIQIEDPHRIPEFVSRAFHMAVSGRPGPVVVVLPEDILTASATVADARRASVPAMAPHPDDLRRVHALLDGAKRPLLMLGGSTWSADAVAALEAFSLKHGLPVACSFRRQDRFDNRHPYYAGEIGIGANPRLLERVRQSDLLIVIGARLNDIATQGYHLISVPNPEQTLVHVYPDPDELGRVYTPDLGLCTTAADFVTRLAALGDEPLPGWHASAQEVHADYLNWIVPPAATRDFVMAGVMAWLGKNLPDTAIMTNGAGNFSTWLHRFHQHRRFGTQLAPVSGSMGYGFPASLAAKCLRPDTLVVCFAGDGDFLMTGQELATAVQQRLNVIVLVINNNMYGTIRMHQERNFPGRPFATELGNPDFAAYARSFGAHGEVVDSAAEFPAAFERSLASKRPALIEIRIDPRVLSPSYLLPEQPN